MLRLSLLLVFSLPVLIQTALHAQPSTYLPGRILIQYEDDTIPVNAKVMGLHPVNDLLRLMGADNGAPVIDDALASAVNSRMVAKKVAPQSYTLFDRLKRTYVYDYIGDMDPKLLAAKLSKMPGVRYAEPWYIAETHGRPDDFYIDQAGHDYFDEQGFFDAWDISTGSPDVIIAIVDSGVDYTHPDLYKKAHVNQKEIPAELKGAIDKDGNGKVTSFELHEWIKNINIDYNGDAVVNLRDAIHPSSPLTSGNDLDNNGYVDDILGWDFWDSGYTGPTIIEDNDPYGEFSLHGTHVAGTAAAETNNTEGVAGTGYRCLYLAVKAGGVRDNPATPGNESNAIGFGYDGILYAASRGAHIINNSWGGGGYSTFAHEVIKFVTSMGSLVVASAGNSGASNDSYPGSYPEVLSVASTDYLAVPIGTKSGFSTFNYNVDVMATGSAILSTYRGTQTAPTPYARLSGTSMASPVVSGLAGLLKSRYPSWSPERIAMQIRATATLSDNLNNSAMAGKLGRGYINAALALSTPMPGYTVIGARLINAKGEKAKLKEPAFMEYQVVNFGEERAALMKLISSNPGIQITTPEQSLSSKTRDTTLVRFPVVVNTVDGKFPVFKIEFSNPSISYYDFSSFEYNGLYFDEINTTGFTTSVNSFGNVGAIDPINGVGVTGFIVNTDKPENQQFDVLFEGGLMILSKGLLADRIREAESSMGIGFNPRSPYVVDRAPVKPEVRQSGSGNARLRLRSLLNSFFSDTSLSVSFESFTFKDSKLKNALFLKYTLKNESSIMADTTYIGLFSDIDIGNSSINRVDYLESDTLMYVHSPSEPNTPFFTVIPVGKPHTLFAINNAAAAQSGLGFGIYDGFSADEKARSLKAGTSVTRIPSGDISTVVATGPYHIMPQKEAVVGFVYVYGNSLEELRTAVAAAKALNWVKVNKPGIVASDDQQPDLPFTTRLHGNYPNPFNPMTTIVYELGQAGNVALGVYNLLGQQVANIKNEYHTPGRYNATFDASRLSSGIYFLRMTTATGSQTHKMTLIK